jgi:hypothetical protein
MKIKTNELLEKIELLKILNNDNDFSGIAKYFYFKNNKIYSTDGRMFIEIDFKSELNNFAIIQTEFHKVLQKIKTDEIEIIQEEEKIIIKSKRTKIEFIINNSLLDKINFNFENNFIKLPSDFIPALKITKFCVNKNATDGSGYLTIENNNIYSTDKYRICNYIFNDKINDMMLPNDCLDILIKLEVSKYQENDNFYLFKKDNIVIGIVKSDIQILDFNKYKVIFDNKNDIKIKLPNDIKENIEMSDIFTDQKNLFQKEIEFIIKNKKLICKSKNEVGMIESEIEVNSELELSFFIHPLFLLEILNVCNEMEINGDIVVFRNDNFNYFFRIKNENLHS